MLDWNPWVIEDRAKEYEAALKILGEWTRAEPELLRKTPAEFKAELDQGAAADLARIDAELAKAETDRAERAARYDPARAEARLRA